MKQRPILFNAEMVKAILDGRKTQTRRVMKVQPENYNYGLRVVSESKKKSEVGQYFWCESNATGAVNRSKIFSCPFGMVGDRLWVRETFQGPLFDAVHIDAYLQDPEPFEKPEYCKYAADGGETPEYYDADDNLRYGWRPSIHMPRWASRITLEITSVRVERLNAISDIEAMREGIQNLTSCSHADFGIPGTVNAQHPVSAFQLLWESIYGVESWQSNPWVWVVEFKRVDAS